MVYSCSGARPWLGVLTPVGGDQPPRTHAREPGRALTEVTESQGSRPEEFTVTLLPDLFRAILTVLYGKCHDVLRKQICPICTL